MIQESTVWLLLRFGMGFTFLWAFFDKVFGLGFATEPEKSWLSGNSPTAGFLGNAVHGPFAEFYNSLAGNPVADWLFMMGLLLIGLCITLGICMRVAGFAGALMMLLMWTSLLPPENNPILDEHIIYLLVFLGFTTEVAGKSWGLGKWWRSTKLVKKCPILG